MTAFERWTKCQVHQYSGFGDPGLLNALLFWDHPFILQPNKITEVSMVLNCRKSSLISLVTSGSGLLLTIACGHLLPNCQKQYCNVVLSMDWGVGPMISIRLLNWMLFTELISLCPTFLKDNMIITIIATLLGRSLFQSENIHQSHTKWSLYLTPKYLLGEMVKLISISPPKEDILLLQRVFVLLYNNLRLVLAKIENLF